MKGDLVMLASAFLEAMSVGIRVTWWLAQALFGLGTLMTYKAFGGLYAKSQAGTWLVVIFVWGFLWTGTLTIFGGYEGMATGLLVGLGWGLFTFLSVKGDWDQDIAAMPQFPKPPDVFDETVEVSAPASPVRLEGYFASRSVSDAE